MVHLALVQIPHSKCNILNNRQKLIGWNSLFLFVEIIEQTTAFKKFSHHIHLIFWYRNTHEKCNIGVIQLGNHFYLFEEISYFLFDFFMPCSSEFFYSNILSQVFSFVNITKSPLSDFLFYVDIFKMDVKLLWNAVLKEQILNTQLELVWWWSKLQLKLFLGWYSRYRQVWRSTWRRILLILKVYLFL